MFKHDGVLPKMILVGSKEQVEGVFRHKLKEVNWHLHVTEPYSSWQQAAKGCICKLKHGVSCKMIKTGAPKCLWDHCIELEIAAPNSLNLNVPCMWRNINSIFPKFKCPMYVMKHKQNILFLNNLFGKKFWIDNVIRIFISW
jgi:hypothetical protein